MHNFKHASPDSFLRKSVRADEKMAGVTQKAILRKPVRKPAKKNPIEDKVDLPAEQQPTNTQL